ncbi:MAG TPA: hypothetical protein VID24_03995 [Candidatus Eremiobacteraceae bacterium]|jgi:hypothetical protein
MGDSTDNGSGIRRDAAVQGVVRIMDALLIVLLVIILLVVTGHASL